MSNVLIFGGSGFIGQNLGMHYKANGDRIWLADLLYPQIVPLVQHFIGCDIRVPYHVSSVLHLVKPDIIINCAGQTSHPLSMANPASDADVNVLGNLVLFEEYRKACPQTLFIHLSSSTVVGPSSVPIDEKTPCHPIDIYSANKLASETYLSVFEKVYNLNVRILRFPNVYGPFGKNEPAYGVLNYWIGQAHQGRELQVYGDGRQVRNLLYVRDVVSAIERAHLAERGPIFVPGKVHLSIVDVASRISEVWGVPMFHVDWPSGRDRIEIGDVIIKSTLFSELTGWEADHILTAGLVETKEVMDNLEKII